MADRHVIVLVYNSFDDPLFKGNLLLLLQHVTAQQPDLRIELITYEQQRYALDFERREGISRELLKNNIIWHPLAWHSGSFLVLKKLYDLIIGAKLILALKMRMNVKSIVSLGTVSGSISYILSKMFWLRHYGYQYEPHSEFMLECGVWGPKSAAFRLLNYFERRYGKDSYILSTGTTHMVDRLRVWATKAKVYRLPSCVDETRMMFSENGRQRVRSAHGFGDEDRVILYLGKFGGIYYEQEVATLFKKLLDHDSELKFLIATPDDPVRIRGLLDAARLPEGSYVLTSCPYEEVPDYISAADFGIVAVPPLPSQRFRSPIKVGEYLCCGLPYLVCRGVSEDDIVAETRKVGVVVENFSEGEASRIYPQIRDFLDSDKAELRTRCREAGIEYRGLSRYLTVANEIFGQL